MTTAIRLTLGESPTGQPINYYVCEAPLAGRDVLVVAVGDHPAVGAIADVSDCGPARKDGETMIIPTRQGHVACNDVRLPILAHYVVASAPGWGDIRGAVADHYRANL